MTTLVHSGCVDSSDGKGKMENGRLKMELMIRKIIATSGLTFVNLAGRMGDNG